MVDQPGQIGVSLAESDTDATQKPPAAVGALVYRGAGIEAIHYASIAVVDGTGRLTHCLGDPNLTVMARSAIKPFQVLPLLLTGAFEHYGFSLQELAVMCGSHNGTDRHRDVVLGSLARSGNGPNHLRCGAHWPLGMQFENRYPANGEDQDPLRHNCSGKHSGFLALARYLGVPSVDYLDPESRSQRLVRQTVAGFCESPVDSMPTSVDGCSAPNFPVALRNLALGFMKLATQKAANARLKQALHVVWRAMQEHPELVSGKDRYDLDLVRSFPGRAVCKVGGEAIEGIGFCEPPLGIAVKIHDGNWRARAPVCVEALKQLGLVGNINDFPLLKKHERPEVRNSCDLITGHVVAEFRLRRC